MRPGNAEADNQMGRMQMAPQSRHCHSIKRIALGPGKYY